MYVCMYVRTYVCMYVRTYVCRYVCMYVLIRDLQYILMQQYIDTLIMIEDRDTILHYMNIEVRI